jgi:hypothetical protein
MENWVINAENIDHLIGPSFGRMFYLVTQELTNYEWL